MQEEKSQKKKLILNALAETLKELRKDKSQFMFASENDISISIISTIERGLKDPQLTTIFHLAEATGLDVTTFVSKVAQRLPQNFSLIEK